MRISPKPNFAVFNHDNLVFGFHYGFNTINLSQLVIIEPDLSESGAWEGWMPPVKSWGRSELCVQVYETKSNGIPEITPEIFSMMVASMRAGQAFARDSADRV